MSTRGATAITMWDFSWLERRWDGAGQEDWNRSLDELAERGYDGVRIDAYPHLVAHGAEAEWRLKPQWDQEDWGSPEPITVRVLPALVEFMDLCRQRGITVALSTWMREDETGARMRIRTPDDLAAAWSATLDHVATAGLADAVSFVDLVNEYPLPVWCPFMYRGGARDTMVSRASESGKRWLADSIRALREAHPEHRYTMSFCRELRPLPGDDLSELDLLELHLWLAADETGDFFDRIGYHIDTSGFDPHGYRPLSGPAEAEYRANTDYWLDRLRQQIEVAAAWSTDLDRPVATTECWGPINYKDGPHRDWGWVKEACEFGVTTAAATGRWEAIATSNFCGPQFAGMWRDVDWHQRLTTLIKNAPVPETATASGPVATAR